ncbi:MAG TPA: Rpn family recombination-promoting nuclease/putative transposase [Thermoanaerobaculia bacterium]|nr:Rpn family recombination-promoting nuclease/putative transposase [Thermoanaerobaculia bacterium]
MGKHDLSYRSLFSFPRMVEDLIREFIPESWVEKLDFSTLQRVNASFVATELRGRDGDLLWKLCLRDGSPVYVYLFIEHQSKVDRFMAVRLMTYIGLLYQTLIKEGLLTSEGRLPLVIPIVLYNGEAEWLAPQELAELVERVDETTEAYVPWLRYRVIDEGRFPLKDLERRQSIAAQIFWLEQSRVPQAMNQGVGRLASLLGGPDDGPLRRAVLTWLDQVLIPRRGQGRQIPEALGLEEFKAMLEKRVEEWNRTLREEGRQEGEAIFLLRLLEQKFGRIDPKTRTRVQSADAERLLDWGLRVLTAERLEDVFN